jgi:E3 ubiquitin-protein ligase SHPRH
MKQIMRSQEKAKDPAPVKSNQKRWTRDREEVIERDLTPISESPFTGWPAYVNEYDIVVTTFQNLQSDLSVARAPVNRPRRAVAIDLYDPVNRPRSPLVAVEWARVIMDEVQLAGGGKTAEMMSLIPRVSSLAVSGTPAKSNVSDLVHVLKFLREDHEITAAKTWKRLIKPGFADIFCDIFSRISIRTLKSQVQHELTIPGQKRYVVGINMGRVERHVSYLWSSLNGY